MQFSNLSQNKNNVRIVSLIDIMVEMEMSFFFKYDTRYTHIMQKVYSITQFYTFFKVDNQYEKWILSPCLG